MMRGFVLITALLFLLIISIFLVSGMQSVILQNKMNQHLDLHYRNLYNSQRAFHLLKENHEKTCFRPLKGVDYYLAKGKKWWLSQAVCHLHFSQGEVAFVIEPLFSSMDKVCLRFDLYAYDQGAASRFQMDDCYVHDKETEEIITSGWRNQR